MYVCIYIYIYIYIYIHALGRHYSSNATRLIRPRSFYASFFVASRIATSCYIIRHF